MRHDRADEPNRADELARTVERGEVYRVVAIVFVDFVFAADQFHVPFFLVVEDDLAVFEHQVDVAGAFVALEPLNLLKHWPPPRYARQDWRGRGCKTIPLIGGK